MDDTKEAGCADCRAWADDFVLAFRQERTQVVESSFVIAGGYFDAYLVLCEKCSTNWLGGYIEDFSTRPIYAEWGDRWWTMRALTVDQVVQIITAEGTNSLDMKTFAAERPGATWTQ